MRLILFGIRCCDYSIKDCKALELSSVGAIVYDHGRIDASTISLPVVNLFINNIVDSLIALPI